MNIEEIKNENLKIHWKITIDPKDVESKYNEELTSISKKISMPGFRPGKVPLHLVKTRYSDNIYADVSSKIIEQNIEKIIKNKDLDLASQPEISDLKNVLGSPIEFILKVEHLPNVAMPDFKKIKLEKALIEISDKDIEDEIKEIAESYKDYKEKKGKAANNDKVRIDFTGKIDGEEFKGGHSENFSIILGSKSMIPGFEDQILEHKAGDEFTIKVKFPENYHAKELSSKEAEFDIKLHEVLKGSLPEIDEKFAKETLKLESLEALKNNVKKDIEVNYKEQVDLMMKMNIFDQLESLLTFDVPDSLITKEYDLIKYQTERDKEIAKEFEGKSQEEIEKYYKKIASRRVRIGLLISQYAKLKHINITQDEVKNEIIKRLKSMPGYEKVLLDFYTTNPSGIKELNGSLLESKVVNIIIEKEVALTEKNMSKEQLDKLIDKENNKKVLF